MRKQTNDDLHIIHNEKDFLEGNINRMCVTNDFKELLSMRNYAIKRIEHIYNVNYKRLTEEEKIKMKELFLIALVLEGIRFIINFCQYNRNIDGNQFEEK